MRTFLMIAIVVAINAMASPSRAQTDSQIPWYPWCAVRWDFDGDHRSCGFVSYEQCRNTVTSGGGEICSENIWGPRPAAVYRSDASRANASVGRRATSRKSGTSTR